MRRRRQRGFTLIELGIVIGVIAVLATVVLVGRGFLESARVSKVVETINTVAKAAKVYAGHSAGQFPGTADNALLGTLNRRNLISVIENDATTVAGFTFVRAAHAANGQAFAITITCPTTETCQDIWSAKLADQTRTTGNINGNACAAAMPTAASITLCFNIF